MRARVTVNERAELVTREGTVVGSLAGVTFDFDLRNLGAFLGGRGEGCSSSTTETSLEDNNPPAPQGEQTALLADPVTDVWSHYQEVIPNGERRKLDTRRRRCIQKALKVRSVDKCKRAITELSKSRFHQGDNDRKTAYNDIEYALGKKSDSPDAVIDRWLERGGQTDDVTPVQRKLNELPPAVKRVVADRMQKVRLMYRSPTHEPTVRAGREAVEQLRRQPGIEPVEEIDRNSPLGGRFTGWRLVGE